MARSRNNPINQIRDNIQSLRHNYAGLLVGTNRAIQKGLGQLTEHELSAIRIHCRTAWTGLKTFRRGGPPGEIAREQARLLQDTAGRMFANAGKSLKIIDNTRREVTSQVRSNLKAGETESGHDLAPEPRTGAHRPGVDGSGPQPAKRQTTTTGKATADTPSGHRSPARGTSRSAPSKPASRAGTASSSSGKRAPTQTDDSTSGAKKPASAKKSGARTTKKPAPRSRAASSTKSGTTGATGATAKSTKTTKSKSSTSSKTPDSSSASHNGKKPGGNQ